MPIYVYEPVEGECHICHGRLELRRPVSRPKLEQCPLCKKPVKQVIEGFTSPKLMKPVSVSDAKKAGFAVYRKLGKGEYERQ